MAEGGDVLPPLPPGDEDWEEPQYNQQQNVPAGGQLGPQPWQFPPWWAPFGQPPQRAPQPQPHKTNLVAFWTHKPRVWFTQTESAFNRCLVTEERMKFDLVMAQLSEDTLNHVESVVEAPELLERPYHALKTRLLEVYQPDTWEQVAKVLHWRELGDQRPSQLMDQLLATLPPGETPGLLFKGIFLDRMPTDLRAHVQGAAEQQSCRQLAVACDAVWLARVKRPAKVAAVTDQVEGVAEQVAAMHVQPTKGGAAAGRGKDRGRGRGSNRGRGSGRPRGKLPGFTCWRHVQFGSQAWQCEEPSLCSFQQQQEN